MPSSAARLNLAYATFSMALGFAAWGLISAFAPTFRSQFQLSAQSTAFLIAVPVLLGSVARLPIGMLTDRFGGRIVFSGLFAFVAVAAALVPGAATYDRLLIICDLAKRLGKGQYFSYPSTREIFDELRLASKGGIADYYGITWERIEAELGVFWPCPEIGHPGTRRLFENGRFYHADGRAHFQATAWRESGDPPDTSFPLFLTTGRVVSHYLSGTQTRRIGPLVEQYPEPRIELHPRLAERNGIVTGDWMRITTRRAAVVAQASVVQTIRPDTVFIPYHWPGRRSANLLTHRTLDPRSKIPEYKVSACRIEKAEAPADLEAWRLEETGWLPDARPPGRRGAS